MPIKPDDRLLHYRVVEKIGEGGMGEVWQATDTSLGREVAIKILPAAFAGDAERLARFDREAKVLASLNHPNIAAIHGLHEDGGQRFLAMELVPGEDLAARLGHGPLPVDDAISCGLKIAEALEYAHERGIVHRDLKPANIKITPGRDVKVLDFGLAKAVADDPGQSRPTSTPTMIPTVTSVGTKAGLILGTAAYMSPEQARGKPVDKRADNWAFGCVLYEMITGRRLFEGETVTDVLAAVVTRAPDWSALPAATPTSVRRLLRRCLDRDPQTRLRDIGEARIVLANPGAAEPASAPPRRQGSGAWRWLVAAAVALVVGTAVGRYAFAPELPRLPVFEFDVTVPAGEIETGSLALSPDGTRLALVLRDEAGDRQLAVRDMNLTEARTLPGTRGASYPFWSPDSTEIAYFSGEQLFRIALDGAAPRPVTGVKEARGGTWGAGDLLLFGSASGPIWKVPASGGRPPEAVTEVDTSVSEDTHAWPAFLPDGKRFVFLADGSTDEGHRLCLASVDGGPVRILKKVIRSQPVVDPSGRLLLGERGQLLAYAFDLEGGVLAEESELLATHMYPIGTNHHLAASAASRGMVAFQNGSPESHVVLVDHAGRVTRTVAGPDRFENVAVSPRGRHIAFEIFTDSPERLVWVQDLERGVRTPVSHRGHLADSPAWSADGEAVYFDSAAGGTWEAYRMSITGGGEPENLGRPSTAAGDVGVLDASRDGRWLLVFVSAGENRSDLYLRSVDGTGDPWQVWASGPAEEDRGAFSPDSRWVAYTSDASGRTEVYVAPLEGGPSVQRWPISSGGGFEPRFSPDGRTIYYRSAAFAWMAVDVRFDGGRVEAGTPRALFDIPQIDLPWLRNLMDVLPDGSGFVTIQPATAGSPSIRVRTGR